MPSFRKIGVLTFHRCINYGSYWQARCLIEGLRGQGHDALVLDHRSARIDRVEWKCALRPTLPQPTPTSDVPHYAAKARRFFAALSAMPLSRPFALEQPEAIEPAEVIVVGSDEVWNFRHPWYGGCPLFFGDGVQADRLVAYAASFGNFDAGEGLEPCWSERLRRFAAIGVRDENSRRLIRDCLDCEPAIVLDPCLQFEAACQREPRQTASAEVVVYGHSFTAWFIRAVRAWATARGVRLVSLGYRNDWADEQRLEAGPEEFAQAMANACAVATNFFHGCVFALVNRKPFVCAPSSYRSHKVTALTDSLGAQNRLVTEGSGDHHYEDALEKPLETSVLQRIEALRQRSTAFLDHALA